MSIRDGALLGLSILTAVLLFFGLRSCQLLDAATDEVDRLEREKETLADSLESLSVAQDSLDGRIEELTVAVEHADSAAAAHRADADSMRAAFRERVALAESDVADADTAYRKIRTEALDRVEGTHLEGLIGRLVARADARMEAGDRQVGALENLTRQQEATILLERKLSADQVGARDSVIDAQRNRIAVSDSIEANLREQVDLANEQVETLRGALAPGFFASIGRNVEVAVAGLLVGAAGGFVAAQ